jgi:hypothetical protein
MNKIAGSGGTRRAIRKAKALSHIMLEGGDAGKELSLLRKKQQIKRNLKPGNRVEKLTQEFKKASEEYVFNEATGDFTYKNKLMELKKKSKKYKLNAKSKVHQPRINRQDENDIIDTEDDFPKGMYPNSLS